METKLNNLPVMRHLKAVQTLRNNPDLLLLMAEFKRANFVGSYIMQYQIESEEELAAVWLSQMEAQLLKSNNNTNRLKNFIKALNSWVGAVICRFFKQYRLVGETNQEGEIHWKAQVRANGLQWKNVVTDNWKEQTNPYLSKNSSIAYLEKEKAISLLNEWKKKVSYVKRNSIIEYVS